MIDRWLVFLTGVALIQGSLGFSPIHEMQDIDDEWKTFYERLENSSYRLPTTTEPRHYEVILHPVFNVQPAPFTFTGNVKIFISPTQAGVNQIVLHCNDLTIHSLTVTYEAANGIPVDITAPNQTFACTPTTSFLIINTNTVLNVSQEYIITSSFDGNLQTNMRGFYRSWYRDSTGSNDTSVIRWMATTQFQPSHARQAFPCYDEPGFKAYFDISISRPQDFSPTLSNMPIKETSPVVNGRITETFYTTPKTSTYLLAFIVSHYQRVSYNNNTARPFDIYARDNIGNHGDWSRDVGERLLVTMEEYTNYSYYGMAPNLGMQQAAIPDFSAGAMENWGLLTYREALILYDPMNSNHFYRQRIANIVAHEIVHMWFGNLVTCAWWDNLWLNEGFARFYQFFLTEMVEPTMGYEPRFIVEQHQDSMISDSVDTAHPLTDPRVEDPTSVSAHFSTITYARGASVLRMTQHLLGPQTFRKALQIYLRAREFNVAEPHNLFSAFDTAAAEDGALAAYGGITIDKYFRTWSEMAGHPLLSITVDQLTGRMTVIQSRWERSTGTSTQPRLYDIPITWTRAGVAEFNNTKPVRIMTNQIEFIERGTSGLEWVLFNKQSAAYYRINYDPTNWNLLTRALRANKNVVHEYNRAQIVDDLFAFGRASTLPYNRVFNILSYLRFEDDYVPWLSAIRGYNFAIRRLAHNETQVQALKNLIIETSEAVVARLGFNEPDNEDYMTSLQRMYVMTFLCDVGHQGCVNAARTHFDSWRNGQHLKANMRPWVYCSGLRTGTAADFTYYWNRYLGEDLAGEQVVLLSSAGCTSDNASLTTFLNAITSTGGAYEIIRPQDLSTALSSAITSNEENTLKAFEWLKLNLVRTRDSIGLTTILNTIIGRLLNENQIAEVTTWLNENQVAIGVSAYNSAINSIATARDNIAWYNRRVSEFTAYFATGYVEENIEDLTTTTTQAPTTVTASTITTTATTPVTEPSSASIPALSVIALLITISINLLG